MIDRNAKSGHFYFGENRTSVLWADSAKTHLERLISGSGLADVASTSEGFAAFRSGSEVETGHMSVALTPDHRGGRVTLPEGATDFVAEGLLQTAMMRFSEPDGRS